MKIFPDISVIMPCYNAEKYIVEAINSILLQDFTNFELLIIDDGSQDKTKQLVQCFDDIRIRYFKLDSNKGNYIARNYGLKHAVGKYIAMADADDISLPNRLTVQSDYLENHSDIYCIGSQYEIIDEAEKVIRSVKRPLDYKELKTMLIADNYLHQPTMMFRNSLVLDHGFRFDDTFRYSGDYDFVVRVAKQFAVLNISPILVRYRMHPSQISSQKRKKQAEAANCVRRKQLEYLGLEFNEEEFMLHLRLIRGGYLEDEELDYMEIWLNRLMESNHVKKVYNDEHLYTLCEQLALRAIKNNQLGGWSIEKELLAHIRKILPPGSSILEFGSGLGTEALLRDYQVTSIEHDPRFCIPKSKHHRCKWSPIEDGWYRRDDVRLLLLEGRFDLVLIDGPPLELRKGILKNAILFERMDMIFVFDDVDRELDYNVMLDFCKILKLNHRVVRGCNKKFSVCYRDYKTVNTEN